MRVKLRCLALLSTAILSLPSHGSENWYRVELLVFTQGNQADINSERWPETPPLSYPLNAIHLQPAAAVTQQLLADELESAYAIKPNNELAVNSSPLATTPTGTGTEIDLAVNDSSDTNPLAPDQLILSDVSSAEPSPSDLLAVAPPLRDWVNQLHELWQQNNILSTEANLNTAATNSASDDRQSMNELWEPEASLPQWQIDLNEITQLVQHFAEYVPLDEDLYELSDSRLTANRYRVLHHSAWHQYIPPASNGEPIVVLGGRQLGEHFELEGTIQLDRQQRYVHAGIDLWMSTFKLALSDDELTEHLPSIPPRTIRVNEVELPTTDTAETDPFSFNTNSPITSGLMIPSLDDNPAGSETWVSTRHFSLNTTQRMRSGVQYYVDHPAFGVVVKLTRYEEREALMDSLLPALADDVAESE
ncbi:CsiV family protein [Umboniibacter marinipuniceus]|uniref:Peptidoglycan-binding protein CsiV n=1 Tax=Umboniibacter marinipuniceus TaxID=569599 RepID=A0A3M0A8H3_9GAMM|nr:CsiV family protein [Umboniibacter marinipuniceus]RMA81150.1 peptidoglycan-binding protein CsiV [Umboniibacter marinipuniceus]